MIKQNVSFEITERPFFLRIQTLSSLTIMARRPDSEYGFTFTNVEIFRDQELGHGSYGAVYKAKCDSLPCAAKFIYPVLFASNVPQQAAPPQDKEHRQPMRRFEAECRFLSQIKHPNIVQYLGVYREPDTNVPVLLMELMDESLTHFLESSQNPVLYHIQVNILHNTILALAFLHSNGITHRDMSGNNVLLIAGSRAKVTDFGMSTLTDAAASHLASMTQCPGTPAYMSPEALEEPPVYSEKLDCFSFGVLTIQVNTREFPKPKDRFQTMEVVNPSHPSRRFQARVLVPELERRQSHINLIPAAHPLRPIALDCIKDRDAERPTAEQLCETLEQFKSTPLYASSVQQVRDRELQLRTQRQTIEIKEQQLQHQRVIIQDKDRQIQDKDQQIQDKNQQTQDKDRQIQDKDRQIQVKDRQIQDKNQQIQDKVRQILDKDRQLWERDQHQHEQLQSTQQENQQLRKMLEVKNQQITELQRGTPQRGQTPRRHAQDLQPQLQQLQLSDDQQTEVKKKPASKQLRLKWRKGPKAPAAMFRGSSTIIGETVYVNGYDSQDVYAFHCNTTWWSTLPQRPYMLSTLTTINSMLTAVGGRDTNKVITHRDHKWVELYPPMPTERCWAAVLSTTTHVAVMGGWNGGNRLAITEVMDIQTKQWSTASYLPYEIYWATTTLCGEFLYLMGGYTDSNEYSVLSCRFSDLVQSTQSTSPSTQKWPWSSTIATHSKVWHNIPDLPVRLSTCVTVQGKVLAIGGIDKQDKRTTSIYELNTDNNEWSHKSDMNIARSECLATALPDNNILVVGGWTGDIIITDETEIATTC